MNEGVLGSEGAELSAGGQLTVDQQEGDFEKAGAGGELVDRVPSVLEFAAEAVYEANRGSRGKSVFVARIVDLEGIAVGVLQLGHLFCVEAEAVLQVVDGDEHGFAGAVVEDGKVVLAGGVLLAHQRLQQLSQPFHYIYTATNWRQCVSLKGPPISTTLQQSIRLSSMHFIACSSSCLVIESNDSLSCVQIKKWMQILHFSRFAIVCGSRRAHSLSSSVPSPLLYQWLGQLVA